MAGYLPSYLDGSEYTAEGRAWPEFSQMGLWRSLLGWLVGEFSIVTADPLALKATKQGILCLAPHGVTSLGHVLLMTDACGFISNIWPVERRDLAASIVFRIPLFREFNLWCGAVDAGKATAHAVLRSGRSLFVYPGGEAEQMRSRRGRHLAYWRSRRGFVKLAVEYGLPLVPAYAFGESELYNTFDFMLGFRLWLCKHFRVALPLPSNVFPYKVPLHVVIGKPLPVPQVNPIDREKFEQAVEKVHAEVICSLISLFDNYKDQFVKDGSNTSIEVIGSRNLPVKHS